MFSCPCSKAIGVAAASAIACEIMPESGMISGAAIAPYVSQLLAHWEAVMIHIYLRRPPGLVDHACLAHNSLLARRCSRLPMRQVDFSASHLAFHSARSGLVLHLQYQYLRPE